MTRAETQSAEAADLLRARGAEPVLVPTLAFGPPDDLAGAEDAVRRIAAYDWVAFTSQNGVDKTLELLARAGISSPDLGSTKVAAVGPATADALARHGIKVDLVAKESHGEGLAKEMLAVRGGAKRVLLLRAQVAREAFPEALGAAGWSADVVPVYATHAAPGLEATLAALLPPAGPGLDAALFSSSSTVTHVCDALGEGAAARLAGVVIGSIGPVTRVTAEGRGLHVDVEASPHTMAALVDALEGFFRARS